MPTNLTFDEAAALPMAAVTALQGLQEKGQLQKGQKVLINGASGGVGTFAVQIAKALGAEVTGVCNSDCVEMTLSLGADHVIDYSKEDYRKSKERYDLIFDIAANCSVTDCRTLLNSNGIYIMVGFSSMGNMMRVIFSGKKDGKRITTFVADNSRYSSGLDYINTLIEAGALKSVIDRRYSLDETAKAFHHAETGHPRGKVIIAIV